MRYFSRGAALAAAASLWAPVAPGDEATERLNPVLVTPTLSTETAEASLSSVTVIDRDTLDRQQPREFSDLLRGQPGVDLTTNGSFGKNTSVFTRGTGSESTILLIDGIRLRSATAGGAPWQFVPPQLLDGAEVVRGPRASLYGADAVGGVVQARTPDGRDGERRWARAGAGSFGSHEYGAGASGKRGNTAYSLGLNHVHTDGQPVTEGGDDRGFHSTSGQGKVTHRFDGGGEVGLVGLRAQGSTEISSGVTDFTQQVAGVHATAPMGDSAQTRVQLSEARDEQDGRNRDALFETRTRTARLQNTLWFGDHEVVFGGELQRDDVDSDTDFDEDSRDNRAVFGQALIDLDSAELQFSARYDDNEAFGDRVTGSVALGHALDRNHRVRLSYGTAFRAPTFNDLFFPETDFGGGFVFAGNPGLAPERSQTAEVGVRGQYQHLFWDVALYETHVEDLIDNATGDDGVLRPTNVDRARIQGVELSGGAELGDWDVAAAASLLDPRDRESGNRLRRRTSQSLRLDVDRRLPAGVSVGATGVVQGDRYDDVANDDRLSGYGLLNLRAGWAFARNWSARLTVDNALDREFETADGFINAGRSAFLSVRWEQR